MTVKMIAAGSVLAGITVGSALAQGSRPREARQDAPSATAMTGVTEVSAGEDVASPIAEGAWSSATTWPGRGWIHTGSATGWEYSHIVAGEPFPESEDALGLDPGPKADTPEWFMKHMFDHPLESLQSIFPGGGEGPGNEFFKRQTSLKGRAYEIAIELGPLIGGYGAAYSRNYGDPAYLPGGAKHREKKEKIRRLSAEFYRLVPRAKRVKVFRAIQKIEAAVWCARGWDGSDAGFDAMVAVSLKHGQGRMHSYAYGMLRRRSPPEIEARHIRGDFKETARFFWALRHSSTEYRDILDRTREFEF